VWPGDVEEVAAVVRACARRRAPVIPFGAGTSLEGHVAALHGRRVRGHDADGPVLRLSVEDLDVTVQAGVTRRRLDERLRPEGVFFPVDPGADATLGGMVATGASGTTTVRYGAMRENVISLRVVTARGEIVTTRSRARKSSAGYDLTRLLVGSEGTLAVICEVTLRLQPTPEAMVAAVCALPSMRAAVDCVTEVLQHGIRVARIELADELQIEAINRFEGTAHAVAPTLFLEFHGSPEEVAAQAIETRGIAEGHGALSFEHAAGEAERRRLWHARHRRLRGLAGARPRQQGA
jgi:D-lactate dehydrogenase (cytochrome)